MYTHYIGNQNTERGEMESANASLDHDGFQSLLDGMTESISTTRESIKKLSTQMDTDTKDGISLLSLKHHLLLSYCQGLVLLSSHRILGHALSAAPHSTSANLKSFGISDRGARGAEPEDLVAALIEKRIVLEKVKTLEGRMRYQIEKLVRRATEDDTEKKGEDVVDDPLAFRPNPQNLVNQRDAYDSGSESASADSDSGAGAKKRSGVYKPPKLVPMPYTDASATKKSKKDRSAPIPTALSHLRAIHDPYIESSTGISSQPTLLSARAKELARMTEFEEENMTRLIMTKKEANRRKRDEEGIALGGTGASLAPGARGRGKRGFGLEDEFTDVLRGTNGGGGGKRRKGDGYEELRDRAKRGDAYERAKGRMRDGPVDAAGDGGRKAKKGRFEKDQMALKRIAKKKSKAR